MKKFVVVENYYNIHVVSIKDTIEEAQRVMEAQIHMFSAGCDESKIKKCICNDRAWAIFDDDVSGEHEKTELYICEIVNEVLESTPTQKYTLTNFKDFCKEAFIMPPFDEPDDWDEWMEEHKITISANDCTIELEYDADAINELEFALEEINEAINGDGTPTTGNTVDAKLRPAELKDIVKFYIKNNYEKSSDYNYFNIAYYAAKSLSTMQGFAHIYSLILQATHENNTDYKCDFSRFNPASLVNVTEEGIKQIVLDMVGSDIEVSYDEHNDKTFIIDYTFKDSGDLIDFFWGSPDDADVQYYVGKYKKRIF